MDDEPAVSPIPEKPLPGLALKQEVPTWWNSTFDSMSSFISNAEALDNMWFYEGIQDPPMLSEAMWRDLEGLAAVLRSFDALTDRLQGAKVLASEALVAVAEFKLLVAAHPGDRAVVAALRATIRAHMDNPRAKLSRILSYLNPDSLAMMCACVDPRAANFGDLATICGEGTGQAAFESAIEATFLMYGVAAVLQWRQRQALNAKGATEPTAKKVAAAASPSPASTANAGAGLRATSGGMLSFLAFAPRPALADEAQSARTAQDELDALRAEL